jgi:hypothetical protein
MGRRSEQQRDRGLHPPLRKKIEKGPIRIATVRGLGYCLEKIPG